jgi:UDP-N-acetylmuramyl pentapeptide synthase
MRILLQKILAILTRKIIALHRPKIVAVTGSVGKTSTRIAIAAALGSRYRVRSPQENYNNEIGLPLAILGEHSPGRSVLGWLKVLGKAARLALVRDEHFPNLLVLEYGIDKPGDMAYLCSIARPNVAVFTAVSPVHAANFGNVETLAEEKAELIRRMDPEGLAVFNADDERVMAMREASLPRRSDGELAAYTTYGWSAQAAVRVENESLQTREDFSFEPGEQFCLTQFDVGTHNGTIHVRLPNQLGRAPVSAALAAAAVAYRLHVPLEEITTQLATIIPPPGRLRPLPGIKGCLLLDDTYNAAPASMAAALDTLSRFTPVESARRIAVLGRMAELGQYSLQEHRLLGLRAAEVVDVLVTVGEEPRDIRRGAIEAGFDETHTQHFGTPEEAGRWLDFNVKKGDIVLVKGSQSARMEKVVKDLMAQPERAEDLLVRQYGAWLEN